MKQFLVFLVLFSAHAFVAKCEDEDIQRPCGSDAPLNEQCVRDFFEENAECSVVSNPDEDEPIVRSSNTYFLPFVNLTIMDGENTLTNANGTIQALFINPNTEQVVMTVFFRDTFFSSPEATFFVSKLAEEPAMITKALNATYPDYFLTAVISLIDGKITPQSVEALTVYTRFSDGEFNLNPGPEIDVYDDVDLQTAYNTIEVNKLTAVQEIFLTEGYSHFNGYLQKYICDFGVSIAT